MKINLGKNALVLMTVAITSVGVNAADKGLKTYEKIYVSVKADNAILFPSSLSKELIESTSRRLVEFANDRAEDKGAFTISSECGPQTLMLLFDIVSITSNTEAVASRAFFSGNISSTAKGGLSIGITSTIRDCITGKRLIKTSSYEDGKEPVDIFRSLVDDPVDRAVKLQSGAMPK